MAYNAVSRTDPTRTMTLRAAFIRDSDKRFAALKREIEIAIVDQDVFAIQEDQVTFLQAPGRRAFNFPRTADKVSAFMNWLAEEERRGILEVTVRPGTFRGLEEAWSDTYIQSAYARGVLRGRTELNKAGYYVQPVAEIPGGVTYLMNQPFHADRVGLMYTRAFDDLKSVTEVMNARIRRQLADDLTTGLTRGIAEGKNPKTIAREMVKDVDSVVDTIGIQRARTIARTEVIRAHHLANVQEFRLVDADMLVSVEAEWLTAGFNVCPICVDLEGKVFYLNEIESMLPAHPNCRCTILPVVRERRSVATPA